MSKSRSVSADVRLKREMTRIKRIYCKFMKNTSPPTLDQLITLVNELKFKPKIDDYLLTQNNNDIYYAIISETSCFAYGIDTNGNPTKNISDYVNNFEICKGEKWQRTSAEDKVSYAKDCLMVSIDLFGSKLMELYEKIE